MQLRNFLGHKVKYVRWITSTWIRELPVGVADLRADTSTSSQVWNFQGVPLNIFDRSRHHNSFNLGSNLKYLNSDQLLFDR